MYLFQFSCSSPFHHLYRAIVVIYYHNNRNDVEGNGYGEKLIQQKQDAIIRRNINFATRHLVFYARKYTIVSIVAKFREVKKYKNAYN